MRGPIALAGVMAAVGVMSLGLGFVIARRLTAAPSSRRFDLTIRAVEQDGDRQAIVLDRTHQTESPGEFTLLFPGGQWVQLSAEVLDRGPGRVARDSDGNRTGLHTVSRRARLVERHLLHDARPMRASAHTTSPSPLRRAPRRRGASMAATRSQRRGQSTSMGSEAREQERSAVCKSPPSWATRPSSSATGTTARARAAEAGRSTLGATEVDDVDAAIQYAIDHGARQVVLFGWSMGAQVALQLAARPRTGG